MLNRSGKMDSREDVIPLQYRLEGCRYATTEQIGASRLGSDGQGRIPLVSFSRIGRPQDYPTSVQFCSDAETTTRPN
jgi:hypothetical protein